MFTIYGRTYCKYCRKAKELLDSLDQSYIYINIDDDGPIEAVEHIKASGWKTVPMVVVEGKFIGGYTELETMLRN